MPDATCGLHNLVQVGSTVRARSLLAQSRVEAGNVAPNRSEIRSRYVVQRFSLLLDASSVALQVDRY